MLIELHISQLAIVDDLRIEFGPGLNVLTGETGAGKSIILSSLELLRGGRTDSELVRKGAETGRVDALFDLAQMSPELRSQLPEICRAEDELLLSREVAAQGRGRVCINGRLGSLAILEDIAPLLFNICGQNTHVRLLDPRAHRDTVDAYGGLLRERAEYRAAYDTWSAKQTELSQREDRRHRGLLREAELRSLVEELGAAEITSGVREALDEQVKRFANAERILAVLRDLNMLVRDGDAPLIGAVQQIEGLARQAVKLDGGAREIQSAAESLQHAVEEFDFVVSRYGDGVELDEEQLEALRSRLAEVARLERKYRTNDAGLAMLLQDAKSELYALGGEDELEALRKEVSEARVQVEGLAEKLSKKRRRVARDFGERIARELQELHMAGSTLSCRIDRTELGAYGIDRIEFEIMSNVGEESRPLRSVASGGELSRITLALQHVLREQSEVPLLVFDEVDTGVSGAVARSVGMKLRDIAERVQVLCVTHQPQVASLAQKHFQVRKAVQGGRTLTMVERLSAEEQVSEIARMISGYSVTSAARESARELMSSK